MIEKLFPCHSVLKVSKFQNELLKSSFLANMNEILTDFLSYFGKNDDFINSFWNLLAFIIIRIQGKDYFSIKADAQND
jgi:hypothetical protein